MIDFDLSKPVTMTGGMASTLCLPEKKIQWESEHKNTVMRLLTTMNLSFICTERPHKS